ncbi:MAG: CRISPR-associated endonuclease Cas2 [Succinivibrionaceae bacterium]|nr:CRISPR-associated endonuclease Cas2 [Succinivibrionaceae bacterium]
MFVILSYDVNQKRVGKVLKTCRKYLIHVQKSVFEGMITEGELKHLQKELDDIIDTETDCILIYQMESTKYTKKQEIGAVEHHSHII